VLSRRRGLTLRTQVGQVLPHPALRMRWAGDVPAETGAPVGIATESELVSERRRVG
jgi:hypothetical protein